MNKAFIKYPLVGLITSAVLVFLSTNWPKTELVAARFEFSLKNPGTVTRDFAVHRTDKFLIEVHLKKIQNEQLMEKIMGDFPAGGGGSLDVSWEVRQGGRVAGVGSSRASKYSPIFGKDSWGLLAGSFDAKKELPYTIRFTVNKAEPLWKGEPPFVVIAMHPSRHEGGIAISLLLMLCAAVVGLTSVMWMALGYLRARVSETEAG
ncbi:MAG: hypothetical protein V3R44_05675 [bacterium]